MYCKNCGKEIREGASFCTECGTKVGAADKNEGIHNAKKTFRKRKTIIIIAVAVIVVIVVLGIVGGSGEDEKTDDTLETTQAAETKENTEPKTPEYKYVGDVLDYMTSDVLNENVEIDGIAVLVSMGMDGTSDCTMQVVLRDEEWNSTISLNGINDADIENYGIEDGGYCTVKGYIYYDEYDAPAIDVHDIQVW